MRMRMTGGRNGAHSSLQRHLRRAGTREKMKCQLRASWTDLSVDPRKVLLVLRDAGVTTCTVTPGWSLCKEHPESPSELECSVIIDLYATEKEQIIGSVWPRLKEALSLTCIHVHELGRGFTGCVHDYMGTTVCPHRRSPPKPLD